MSNSTTGAAVVVPPAEPPVVAVGDALPSLTIEGTPTFIVSAALATRDFEDVHHDRDRAQQRGSKDMFVNILTDTGLVQRYVTDWAGQKAVIRSISLRLGVPWYAYDTLTMAGSVESIVDGLVTLAVTGTDSLGKHITSTVTLVMDGTIAKEADA
ncbi:MaoC family dehydratase [Rhodococcus sp. D2-41]|uniref:MaoC family dehydratase n=1 Tax=Speluncibacter jeojiensis TaxID=2710754 RepID=A0A9X4RFW6_9ACTN|nr:MaoC family dehydratase [Rhodococcus sp. D2-41]MDG3009912.1 MaoC family dehydratase [Rhodococcus sp. D2-41]MDG3017153.1 MaoC family dehydratase [Corynebacteriales bacterium D3-21]